MIVGFGEAASDDRGIGCGLLRAAAATVAAVGPLLPTTIDDDDRSDDDDADDSCDADCVGEGGETR